MEPVNNIKAYIAFLANNEIGKIPSNQNEEYYLGLYDSKDKEEYTDVTKSLFNERILAKNVNGETLYILILKFPYSSKVVAVPDSYTEDWIYKCRDILWEGMIRNGSQWFNRFSIIIEVKE